MSMYGSGAVESFRFNTIPSSLWHTAVHPTETRLPPKPSGGFTET